jgi:hypothetical protein
LATLVSPAASGSEEREKKISPSPVGLPRQGSVEHRLDMTFIEYQCQLFLLPWEREKQQRQELEINDPRYGSHYAVERFYSQ